MRLAAQRILPYAIVLAVCSYLYFLATGIQYNGPPGRIGPDVWPKAILLLAIATCCYEIVRQLVVARESDGAQAQVAQTSAQPTPTYTGLLVAGIALTIAYLLVIERIGFFLTTALYLAGFMLVGRYRRLSVVVTTSLAGALIFVFVFMKVVYVSLPLGQGPFAQVSLALMRLMGIR